LPERSKRREYGVLNKNITPLKQGVKRQDTTMSSMLMNPKAKKVYPT
jgi:hypothetical protein